LPNSIGLNLGVDFLLGFGFAINDALYAVQQFLRAKRFGDVIIYTSDVQA